jgi:hypothetical protein
MKRRQTERQTFSCERIGWSSTDVATGKPRFHWDYKAQEWRSGKRGRIFKCKLCDEMFLPYFMDKMCRRCVEIVRGMTKDYQQLRQVANTAVARAVRRREMLPPAAHNCVDCGAEALCYDHRDYTKPLDVVPVCRSCNVKRGYGTNLPEYLNLWRAGNGRTFKPHPELRRLVQEAISRTPAAPQQARA